MNSESRSSNITEKKKGWTASPWLLSQMLHFTLGFALPLAAVAKGLPWFYGGVPIVLVALIKETTFDQWVEKSPFFMEGLVDLMFYVLGVSIAVIFLKLPIPHVHLPIPYHLRDLFVVMG